MASCSACCFCAPDSPARLVSRSARPQERDGAQHGARLAVAPIQHHDLLLKGALRTRDHRGVQAREQFPRFVQRRYRVVVAAQHHQLAAGALQFHHEAVVQLAGVAGRRAGIEQIPGDDQRIHLLLLDLFDQPVQKSLVLGGAAFGEKVLAKMPVRGVDQAHDTPGCKGNGDDYKGRGGGCPDAMATTTE